MSTIVSIISIIIAAISAFFSGLTFYSNRAVLIKFSDSNKQPLPMIRGEIYAHCDKKTVPFKNGILFHFQILNPSPKDIAYFHMQFISDDRSAEVWTLKSFGYMKETPKIIIKDPIKGEGEINIPSATQGVFKAHSFTPIYAFMSTEDHPFPQKVNFQFKYSVRRFPFVGSRSYYRIFSTNLDLTSVESEMQSKQKAMRQLTSQEQKSPKSRQTPPYKNRNKRKHH